MSMGKHRMPDASRIAAMAATAPKGVMAVGQHFDPRAGREAMDSIEVVARELGETKGVVADMLKAWADFSKSGADARAEIQARLGAIEQVVAMREAIGSGAHSSGGPSVGAQALQELGENSAFVSASETAQRGGRPSGLSVRANLSMPINAALTGDYGAGTSEGTMPSQPGRSGIFAPPTRPLTLLDVLPRRAVANDSIEHVRLHASGNAAEQVDEGDVKQEITLDGELVRAEVATVAAWTSASRQVLSDHAALQATIDRVVRGRVLAEFERLLVVGGSGSSGGGRIRGLVELATPFVPVHADSAADIVGESLMALASSGYRGGVVVMHPADFFALQIEKTATEKAYLFGSPLAPIPPAMWGASIITTSSVDQGEALALDPAYVTVLDREQLSIEISNSHGDYFVKNLIAVLCELRGGLEVTDSWAVYKFDLPQSSE